MSNLERTPALRLLTSVAAMLLAVACTDRTPTAIPSEQSAPMRPSLGDACQRSCLLLDADLTLRALHAVADSAANTMELANVLLSGQRGDTIALIVDAAQLVLSGLPEDEIVLIRVGSSEMKVPLRTLDKGALVYRFPQTMEIAVQFSMTRRLPIGATGKLRLTQETNARVRSANRPWAGLSSSLLFDVVDPALCESGAAVSHTGNYCGVDVTFDHVVPAEAFLELSAMFQSDEGTGQSHQITVTFSRPVPAVFLGIYDPTFAGNNMIAYDSAGHEIGRAEFQGNGQPGVFSAEEGSVHGRISKVVLNAAFGDFVAYAMYVQFGGGCHVGVTSYGQFQLPWGPDEYDHMVPKKTMKQKGCALTSLTMGLTTWSPTLDPGFVNSMLKNSTEPQFSDGGMIWPLNASYASLGHMKFRATSDTAAIHRELCAGYGVVVGVKLNAKGRPGHFVLVTGIESDGSFTINDPATGGTRPLTDYAAFAFRGAIAPVGVPAPAATSRVATARPSSLSADLLPAPEAASLGMVAANGTVMATNAAGARTSFDPATGATETGIPSSFAWGEGLDDDETGEEATAVTTTVAIDVLSLGTYRLDIIPAQTRPDSAVIFYVVPGNPTPTSLTKRFDAIAGDTISYDATIGMTGLTVVPSAKPHVLTKYVCGNSFELRNKNGVPIDVSYLVPATGETAVLSLPARPANSPYSTVTFSTQTADGVSIYAYGTLIDTRANERRACP